MIDGWAILTGKLGQWGYECSLSISREYQTGQRAADEADHVITPFITAAMPSKFLMGEEDRISEASELKLVTQPDTVRVRE